MKKVLVKPFRIDGMTYPQNHLPEISTSKELLILARHSRKHTVVIRRFNMIYCASEAILEEVFELFEMQPEGGRLWRGVVNGRETALSMLEELSAKTGKPVFAMNLQTREILETTYPDKQAS